MPIFTGTPVETVPASPFLWIHHIGLVSGPFHYGGAIYLVGYQEDITFGLTVGIAKSADAGATWTGFFPTPPGGWGGSINNAILDLSAGKIVILGTELTDPDSLTTFTFDLGAETFSSPASLITSGIFAGPNAFPLIRKANGDVIAIYHEQVGASQWSLMGVPVVGGAFGVPFVIDAGIAGELLSPATAVCDDSNVTHIAYTLESPSELLYITLDAGNGPGARSSIASLSGPTPYNFANALVWNGRIIFLRCQRGAGGQFYVGNPSSAPVWNLVSLPIEADSEIVAIDAGSTIKFLYSYDNGPALNIWQVQWDGAALDTPVVFWDIIVNPPPSAAGISAAFMRTSGISADLTDGVLGVAVTTCIDDSPLHLTAVYVSVSGSTAARYRNRLHQRL